MSVAKSLKGEDEDAAPAQKYYGKYRGVVVNNIDPEKRGRLLAIVPDVSSLFPTSWAMPCFPVGGIQMGIFTVPLIGAGVWIEFEQGDPDYPIWVGCFPRNFCRSAGHGAVGAAGGPGHHPANALAEWDHDQRYAWTYGRNPDEDDDRRADFDQRHRNHHFQWQGSDNHDAG